jgi:hypothetical protein
MTTGAATRSMHFDTGCAADVADKAVAALPSQLVRT